MLKFLSQSKTAKVRPESMPLIGGVEHNRDRPYAPEEEFCNLCFNTDKGNRDLKLTTSQARSLYLQLRDLFDTVPVQE